MVLQIISKVLRHLRSTPPRMHLTDGIMTFTLQVSYRGLARQPGSLPILGLRMGMSCDVASTQRRADGRWECCREITIGKHHREALCIPSNGRPNGDLATSYEQSWDTRYQKSLMRRWLRILNVFDEKEKKPASGCTGKKKLYGGPAQYEDVPASRNAL